MNQEQQDLIAYLDRRFSAMTPPVTQGMLMEVKAQIEDRIDGGHGRVRASLNALELRCNEGFRAVVGKQERVDERLENHSERLTIIQTERGKEREVQLTRKQDHRDHVAMIAILSSAGTTIGLFLLKSVFHL